MQRSIGEHPKGEKWSITNTPRIIIQGSNFENGKKILIITSGDDVIAKKEINVARHSFVEIVALSAPIENPREPWMEVGVGFHRESYMERLHTLMEVLSSILSSMLSATCPL